MYDFIYYQARDVMTPDPVRVNQSATLSEVEAIFEEHDFNAVQGVDESHWLIGIITKLDVLRAFAFTENSKIPLYDSIMNEKISLVMTKDPHVVHPETPLTRVLQDMIETGHKSFLVAEKGNILGIVAREDVLRALRQAAQGKRPHRRRSA